VLPHSRIGIPSELEVVGDGDTFCAVRGKTPILLTSVAAAGMTASPTTHFFAIKGLCGACAVEHNHNRKCDLFLAAARRNASNRGKAQEPRANVKALPALSGSNLAEREAEFATRARAMGVSSGKYCLRFAMGKYPKGCHRAHIDTTWTATPRAAPANRPPPSMGVRATATAWSIPAVAPPPTTEEPTAPVTPLSRRSAPATQNPPPDAAAPMEGVNEEPSFSPELEEEDE